MSLENINIAITYMKMRNSYNHGFLKYYYFKRVIGHCTGLSDPIRVRAIFQKLLESDVIERSHIYLRPGKYVLRYRFNPFHLTDYFFYENNDETKI
jgi:hypothetical protein